MHTQKDPLLCPPTSFSVAHSLFSKSGFYLHSSFIGTLNIILCYVNDVLVHMILKLHLLEINPWEWHHHQPILYLIWTRIDKSHIIISSKGFYIACDESENDGSPLALPNSQLAAQLESFGDFYTKRLSLIIKFSDCSFIDCFIICISTFPLLCFFPVWEFFTLCCSSISLQIWRDTIVKGLAFWFFCLFVFGPQDRWSI